MTLVANGQNNAADSIRTAVTHVSLHTAQPNASGSSEVSGGTYARQAETSAASSGGVIDFAATDLAFTLMPAVTVTHFGLWSASTAGTFYGWGTCTNRTLLAGDTYNLTDATLTVT